MQILAAILFFLVFIQLALVLSIYLWTMLKQLLDANTRKDKHDHHL